jgi:hypothetical protein
MKQITCCNTLRNPAIAVAKYGKYDATTKAKPPIEGYYYLFVKVKELKNV